LEGQNKGTGQKHSCGNKKDNKGTQLGRVGVGGRRGRPENSPLTHAGLMVWNGGGGLVGSTIEVVGGGTGRDWRGGNKVTTGCTGV